MFYEGSKGDGYFGRDAVTMCEVVLLTGKTHEQWPVELAVDDAYQIEGRPSYVNVYV